MASSLVLAFVVVGFVNCAISSPDNNVESMVGSVTDYPVGDPRRCFEMARKNGYKMAVSTFSRDFVFQSASTLSVQFRSLISSYTKCVIVF